MLALTIRKRLGRGFASTALLLLAACGDGDPLGTEDPVTLVEISPDGAELPAGDTVRFFAVARSASGDVVPGRDFTWSSGDTTVIAVAASGLVTARGEGRTQLHAATAGRSASVEIHVLPEPAAVPAISALAPASIQAGWGPFTLGVSGTGFSPFATVLWNEIPLGTVVLGPTELHAAVPAGLVTQEGGYAIVVRNPPPGLSSSEPATFTVHSPPASSVELLVGGNAVFVENRLRLDAIARNGLGEPLPGKRIEWTSSDTTIARIEADGSVRGRTEGSVTLTATAQPASRSMTLHVLPAPSADILFTSSSEAFPLSAREALVRSLGPGGGIARMLPLGTWVHSASPSPDGSRIAFAGRDDAGNVDIYVVKRDGTGLTRLTSHSADDDQPAWSPDGLRIAFRSRRAGKSDVWVMNADGSGQTNLTSADVWLPGELNERPAWSPDSSQLAFSRGFGLGQSIYSVPAGGGALRLLVSRPGASLGAPAWSPDGTVLAYRLWDFAAQGGRVEFAYAETGEPVLYAATLPPDADSPAWLEGGWLAVSARAHPGLPSRTIALLRLDADRMAVPLEGGTGYAVEPRWIQR